jgi:hypothetical protein
VLTLCLVCTIYSETAGRIAVTMYIALLFVAAEGERTMGSLFAFPPAADSDLPFARRALDRNRRERGALVNERGKLQKMRADLEARFGAVGQAEQERDALLVRDAQSLVDRLRNGAETTLANFGLKARSVDEKISASVHRAKVAQLAIDAIDRELVNIEAKMAELDELSRFLVNDTILEATASEFADYRTACENLRDSIVRLSALSRVLKPPTHDFVHGANRIAVIAPDFAAADGSELAIVAEPREIARVEAILRRYAEALALDARTPFPDLPEVDTSDDGAIYSDLSAPERRVVDQSIEAPVVRTRPAQHY